METATAMLTQDPLGDSLMASGGSGGGSTASAMSGPLGGFGAQSAGGGAAVGGEGMSLMGMGGASAAMYAVPYVGWAMAALTVAQGVMKMGQAKQEAAAMEERALWNDFAARQEMLRGRQAVLEQKRQMGKIVASNIASGFASGFRGGGSITQASKDVIAEAEFQMDMTRTNSEMQAGQIKAQAGQTRKQASMTRQGGLFDALTPVAELGIASYARGDIG